MSHTAIENNIAQRAKSRPLYANAEQQLKAIAEARCLSEEQLKDRTIPMLGLDASQPLVFDFGPRQFSVRFDEHLQLIITDQQGARQKTMPRLREDDDPLKAPEALAGEKHHLCQLLAIRYRGWQQACAIDFCYSLPPYRLMLTISPGFAPYGIDAIFH